MASVDSKPPRKADQLLQALSKKYEDNARNREARSSGRNTPNRQTPRSSRERLSSSLRSESADNITSRESPYVRSSGFSPLHIRSPSAEGAHPSQGFERRSPAVRASPSVFERTRSPGRRVSPVQSPGLFERARTSPSPSPIRRQSPSPAPSYRRSASKSPERVATTEKIDDHEERVTRREQAEERSPKSSPARERPKQQADGQTTRDSDSSSFTKLDQSKPMSEISNERNVARDLVPESTFSAIKKRKDEHSSGSPQFKKRVPVKRDGNQELNRSFDLTSNTFQDDRPDSQLSTASNFSFSQPLAAGSPRSSATTSPLPRTYAIEKEQMDSQLRRFELENVSLKSENKSLKDKYNRAKSQIVHLETKLKTKEDDLHKIRVERKKELTISRQKTADAEESFQELAREERDELHRKIELLRVENESLEKELQAARRLTDMTIQSSDISKIVAAYKTESSALRDEIKKIKVLLKESEKGLENEVNGRNRIIEANKKLAEMNNILKQQLDVDSGGTFADKQVKAVESRLKITEDRLLHERADRAGKLSEIEDKLLNENARLQIDVKEVMRQLKREQEKLKNNELKLQELKDQQMSLSFLTQPQSSSKRYISSRHNTDKIIPEVARIMETLKKETGSQFNQEDELIVYLFNKERAVMKQLNDWKNELKQLKDLERQSRSENSTKKLIEELNDAKMKADDTEAILKAEITKLVQEKHDLTASLKSSEDKIEAIEAELEYLRVQIKVGGTISSSSDQTGPTSDQDQMKELKSQLHSIKSRLSQHQRKADMQEAEISSLQQQLNGKTTSLEEAIKELEIMRKEKSSGESEGGRKQRRIEELNIELKSTKSDVAALKEKNKLLAQTKQELEAKVEEMTSEVDKANASLLSFNQDSEAYTSQKLQLESELQEKTEEIKVLKERYQSLEDRHTDTREQLILSKDQLNLLHKQNTQLQQQLSAKNSEFDSVTSRLMSQETSYTTTEEKLLASQKLIEELNAELSVEKLNASKLKSDYERESLSHQHELERSNREIKSLTASLDNLKHQKSEFSKEVEISKVKIAELQTRLSEAQSDISNHKEKETMLSKERDKLTEEKHEAKLQAARVEAEHRQQLQDVNRQIMEVKHQNRDLKANFEAVLNTTTHESDKIAAELENSKRLLNKKETEMTGLTASLHAAKRELENKLTIVRELELELEEEKFNTKEQMDELNQNLKERDHQIALFKESLKHLDDETRTKRELEMQVKKLENELQEKTTTEIKLKSEIALANERKDRDQAAKDKLIAETAAKEEQAEAEVNRLKQTLDKTKDEMKQLRNVSEKEKANLQDKFNQVNADLKAAEATISVMNESKQSQSTLVSSLERKNESLKTQLQEIQVNCRLAEQKTANLKDQLDESRTRLTKADEKVAELSAAFVKLESEVKIEKEKSHYLRSEKEDVESAKLSSDYKVDMLQREIDSLQGEIGNLREQIDTQKEHGENRTKKQSQQFKDQIERHEKEKQRVKSQNQELTINAERLKDQLASRTEEIQKHKHQIAVLEQKLADTEHQLSKAEDAVTSHDDIQDKLNKKNLELELELNELKNLVSRMEGNITQDLDSSKIDNLTRAEINRTMTEWSQRLKTLLDSERNKHPPDDTNLSSDGKVKITELESKLKHEQLMHTVTKNQLKALEDENVKLRKRILSNSTAKRRPVSHKSKEELIQEKILESEMRVAAQLGMSGSLLSTKSLTTQNFGSLNSQGLSSLQASSTLGKTQRFNNTSILGSLGFMSTTSQRLNNAFSSNNSCGDEDSPAEL